MTGKQRLYRMKRSWISHSPVVGVSIRFTDELLITGAAPVNEKLKHLSHTLMDPEGGMMMCQYACGFSSL